MTGKASRDMRAVVMIIGVRGGVGSSTMKRGGGRGSQETLLYDGWVGNVPNVLTVIPQQDKELHQRRTIIYDPSNQSLE